jgi:flavin-dependent dehydrogenase
LVSPDVLVVGGGVAGSATARELGRRGLKVLLLEKARHPRPKPCGEGLLPHGVAALRAMGLECPGVPVRGLRYVSHGGAVAETDFPQGHGIVVRRERFDAYLFEQAASTPNVEALCGTAYDPRRWSAPWTVGSDGLNSAFHADAAFGARKPKIRRVGLSTHVEGLHFDRERVEVLFHPGGEVYLAPSEDGDALVACLYRTDSLPSGADNGQRVLKTLRSVPALRDRCGDLNFTTPVLGAGPLGLSLRTALSGQVLLVGDAAGAPDPVTGEGMSLALLSANLLAEALEAGDPNAYAAGRRLLGRNADWLSKWILRASRYGWIADRVVASLAQRPDLFSKLVQIGIGARPPGDPGLADLVRMAL